MRALDPAEADRLMVLAYDSLRTPVVAMLERAQAANLVALADLNMAAMGLISLIESVHAIPLAYRTIPAETIGQQLADMLFDGWRRR